MDREKVIKGIQECDLNGGLIGNCPYKGILALLKEKEPAEPVMKKGRLFTAPTCRKCGYFFPTGTKPNYCQECGQAMKWE